MHPNFPKYPFATYRRRFVVLAAIRSPASKIPGRIPCRHRASRSGRPLRASKYRLRPIRTSACPSVGCKGCCRCRRNAGSSPQAKKTRKAATPLAQAVRLLASAPTVLAPARERQATLKLRIENLETMGAFWTRSRKRLGEMQRILHKIKALRTGFEVQEVK